MKKLKQALSLTLALVLSLALAAPAMAAPVTVGDEFNFARTTFSDVVSQETVKGSLWSFDGDPNAIPLITVKVGTTITVDNNGAHPYTSGREFKEAEIKEDGSYAFSFQGKSFNTGVADGTPFTLTDKHVGLWYFGGGSTGKDYYLNIIAGDGSAAAPAEPAQPAEPEKPAEPEQPAVPAVTIPEGSVAYTVQKGDTLGQIAAAEYGSANAYKAIFERNSDRLKDANTIYEGQVIVLPAKK